MCGIIGLLLADENSHVNQLLFDGLTVLQHRGQDAAGIVTSEQRRLHLRKDNGMVRDVFQPHHMSELRGHLGIGHCRYPTAGTSSCAEAQPLYTNFPHGICVAHNGNLTNANELTLFLREKVGRHVNTDSDSELLLNVFAEHLMEEERRRNSAAPPSSSASYTSSSSDMAETIFAAMTRVMHDCKGGFAGIYLINGIGLVGFRDPHGIRPLVFGCRRNASIDSDDGGVMDDIDTRLRNGTHGSINHISMENGINHVRDLDVPQTPREMDHVEKTLDYVFSSESVAIDTLGFRLVRDVRAGESIFIDMEGNCHSQVCFQQIPSPCIFEYVYFARPDSIMDGISVYETRLKMGEKLAEKIKRVHPNYEIDVVIPIPDTSRTCALQAAYQLNRPFREGFIKNRYIARTFIMPGQETRKKSVRLKLNTIKSEFNGRNVLLVDDSIVRGTTAHEIVQMARDAGARKVFFCSAAPAIRYPNIYGIDIPTRKELVAFGRQEDEIAAKIGCDWIVYQELEDLQASVLEAAPKGVTIPRFDTSCFSGEYVTGEQIEDSYFTALHNERNDGAKERKKRGINGEQSPSKNKKPLPSNDGCESVSNDKRGLDGEKGEGPTRQLELHSKA
ncbi:hypothetical protein ACA910_016787 [Epithemia clementina (nom. ined.)]